MGLDPETRLTLDQIPLLEAPSGLGIDRALGGWQAWCESRGPVLVADAGTALSLTRVDGDGRFVGGRLQAGAGLQWKALAEGTAALPLVKANCSFHGNAWPSDTTAALRVGVLRGLAAAVKEAWMEARQHSCDCRLWITGGDGPALSALLDEPCDDSLVLRGLARFSPDLNR